MKKVNVVPNASMLNSLRDVGYNEVDAISDIIDNSLDAGAKNIKIDVIGKDKVMAITIKDDGIGMDISTLKQALTLGSNVTRNTGSLGHYGLGLKTAAISIGKEFSVLTRKSKEKACLGIFDIGSMIATNSYDIELDTYFKKSLGTSVTIDKIDKLTSSTPKTYIKALKAGLGLTFTNILSTVNITINGEKLLPVMIAPKGSKNFSLDTQGKQKTYSIYFKENNKRYKIKVKMWALPVKKGTGEIDYSQRNQGFYVFRNNRLIATGQDLGFFNKSTGMNRFRAEVYFNNMDEVKSSIGLNFSKRGVNFRESLSDVFKGALNSIIKEIREHLKNEDSKDSINDLKFEDKMSRKFTKQLKQGMVWPNGISDGTVGAVLTGAAYSPPKPKSKSNSGSSKIVVTSNQPTTHNYPSSRKSPTPNKSNKNTKKNLPTGAITSVIIQKKSLGKDSIYWRFDDINDGTNHALQITLNVDHIYYQDHYLKASEATKTSKLEQFLTTGRGMIEGGLVTEDTEDMINDMFDNIGDDCRVIA